MIKSDSSDCFYPTPIMTINQYFIMKSCVIYNVWQLVIRRAKGRSDLDGCLSTSLGQVLPILPQLGARVRQGLHRGHSSNFKIDQELAINLKVPSWSTPPSCQGDAPEQQFIRQPAVAPAPLPATDLWHSVQDIATGTPTSVLPNRPPTPIQPNRGTGIPKWVDCHCCMQTLCSASAPEICRWLK